MEIRGSKLRVREYLTVSDVEMGEVFVFADDTDTLYIMGDGDVCIDLGSGETCDPYEYDLENKPIRKVKCHLEVEGFE